MGALATLGPGVDLDGYVVAPVVVLVSQDVIAAAAVVTVSAIILVVAASEDDTVFPCSDSADGFNRDLAGTIIVGATKTRFMPHRRWPQMLQRLHKMKVMVTRPSKMVVMPLRQEGTKLPKISTLTNSNSYKPWELDCSGVIESLITTIAAGSF